MAKKKEPRSATVVEPPEPSGQGNGSTLPVRVETTTLVPADRLTVEQRLEVARRAIEYRKGLAKLIGQNVSAGDIVVYGRGENESVHFTKAACIQVLSWAGVSFVFDGEIRENRYEGEAGPYIEFEARGELIFPDGRRVAVMGNRSTYDDFFAKRSRYICPECKKVGTLTEIPYGKTCPTHPQARVEKDAYYLAVEEVDIPSVRQAAVTNLWNHALEYAGLKPSLKDLLEAGLNTETLKRVEFSSGGKPASAGKPAPQAKPPSAPQPQAPTKQTAASVPISPTPKASPPPAPSSSPAPSPSTVARDGERKSNHKAKNGAPQPALGSGVVERVESGRSKPPKNSPYRRVAQNSYTLYCHDNRDLDVAGTPQAIFDLLDEAGREGWYCEFQVETSKDGKWNSIKGATRMGPHHWEPDGTPVLQWGEPSPDAEVADPPESEPVLSDSEGFAGATDEDVPL